MQLEFCVLKRVGRAVLAELVLVVAVTPVILHMPAFCGSSCVEATAGRERRHGGHGSTLNPRWSRVGIFRISSDFAETEIIIKAIAMCRIIL